MFGLSKPNPKDKGAKLAQAQNQAPDSIPGMFKPGEFVLPPDTVHAMGGKQALQGAVNATHTPVTTDGMPTAGLGLKPSQQQPEVFFNNGGSPEDQLRKGANAPVSPSNIFPQASPSAGANIYAGAGLSRDQFGSSGKIAQIPPTIGQQPGRQVPAPAPAPMQPAAPASVAPAPAVVPTQSAPVAPVVVSNQAPSVPSPSNTFPGSRLQGNSGFSGAPSAPAPAPAPAPATAMDPAAELRRIADKNSRGERYGSDAPTMASVTPAAAQAPRNPGASELYMQDRAQEMGSQWNAGNYAQAVGTAGRTAVQGLGMYGIELADKAITPVGNAIGGFAKGLFGMGDAQAAPTPTSPSVTSPASVPVPAPDGYTQKSQGVMGPPDLSQLSGQAATPSSAALPSAAPSASQSGELPAGVYNHGRGQYSDQAGGMGLPAGFTGKPNAQNMAAAANLSATGSANAGAGLGLPQQQPGFSAPTVTHSGNDWAARQRLKDMETSASSITNRAEWSSGSSTPAWGSRQAQGINDPAGKIGRYNAAVQADLVAQGKAPELQQKTNEVNAGLQRAAMGEAGADRRATLAESGASSRAAGQVGLGLQRLSMDQQRINSEERLRAPQIRAAERLGQLQDAFVKAKTPEEQAAIATQIRAYAGKNDDQWKAVALQGGTDAAGNKTESMLGAVNERTGEMKRMGAQQQAPQYVKGTVYEDASGNKQRWNGTAFESL